ncbi:MAG: hypothetical protein Q9227_007522 [Pyrenula ochraceoflavens]
MEVTASPVEQSPTTNSPLTAAPKREPSHHLVPSHGISIDIQPPPSASGRPSLVKHMCASGLRKPQEKKYVTSEDDGAAQHRINQYIIKQEIGRGSFGAVHLGVDQYGHEYAIKEFSKSRLRKRAQSHILRHPRSQRRPGHLAAAGGDFNSPLHRDGADPKTRNMAGNSIGLIKEEIAIMKKLHHHNLVALIEVLDDPAEDSLYMVMEMCKKGVVMKVGLDERADPYSAEECRCWFRDLILGIEYLHAQGVVHRDIKPDNCLLTEDDVLKIVDFGVSEMFAKDSEMVTAKSAGSPAFLPPELCVVKHGDVSGKASDIWSMGVTLYCLRYGRIPFEKSGIFELYESIKTDDLDMANEEDEDFRELIYRILEKDPKKRITMAEIREHAWVTRRGADSLLSFEENTADLVEPPTEEEMNRAITGNMKNLIVVMKAVRKFKGLLARKRPTAISSILGEDDRSRYFQPPLEMHTSPTRGQRTHSLDVYDRRPVEGALTVEGLHRLMSEDEDPRKGLQSLQIGRENEVGRPASRTVPSNANASNLSPSSDDEALPPFRPDQPHQAFETHHAHTFDVLGQRGHAHDPLEDKLYLHIGPSTFSGVSTIGDGNGGFVPNRDDVYIVSESPGAADVDIYETAYRDEIERIQARLREEGRTEEPQVFLNRRVDTKLVAIGGLAGRLMAMGEEGIERVGDLKAIKEGRVKVSGMSKVLRSAAKEEYERRRADRRARHHLIGHHRPPEAKTFPPEAAQSGGPTEPIPLAEHPIPREPIPEPQRKRSSLTFMTTGPLAEKAWEKSKQARTSFKDMFGRIKERGSGSG